jgi:AraC-like DNA-binding protein
MKDTDLLWQQRNSAIFHKNLEQDLREVEFYTNVPCFIYIRNGTEILTNGNHDRISLSAGDSIFLAQGLNLHSDFVRETKALSAELVFFDDELIADYLSGIIDRNRHKHANHQHCEINKKEGFDLFFRSLEFGIKEDSYFNGKLLELLHLIAHADETKTFHSLLSASNTLPPKKNLIRLLDTVETIHLSVSDLAHLSGRSLSTFNRDFKTIYQIGAKQWLLEKRLSKARELIQSDKHTVTDVALMVGYSNVSHFIKAFKLKYGLTPNAYRLNCVTEKE